MTGNIIDITNVCLQLVKANITDQTFQIDALTIDVLDIYQHPEVFLKRVLLHLGFIHLEWNAADMEYRHI